MVYKKLYVAAGDKECFIRNHEEPKNGFWLPQGMEDFSSTGSFE
jgi:hypothetical protein